MLTHAQHLGLYTAFHANPVNRLLHLLTLGGVFFSAMCLLAPWPVVAPGLMGLLFVTTWRLTRVGAVGTLLLGLGACAVASTVAGLVAPVVLVPTAIVVHLLSWWVSVRVCHGVVEPLVMTETGLQDTNVYFRRGYYFGRGLGVELHPVDRWTQFVISALSSTWEVLELLGVKNVDDAEIAEVRAQVRERLAAGQPLFRASEVAQLASA